MVTYIKSDLDFILDQIKIAEANAGGQPLYGPGGLIPSYNISWGLRTVDGTYNNLLNPTVGAADQPFPTLLDPVYRPAGQVLDMNGPSVPGGTTRPDYTPTPGISNSRDPNGVVVDADVRTISNLLVDQSLNNPSVLMVAMNRAGLIEGPDAQIAKALEIKAAYAPIKDEFKAYNDAHLDANEARRSAAADPNNAAKQQAAADATAAEAAAQANLDAVRGPLDAALAGTGIELDGVNVLVSATAPDEGLSAPFNSWFTLFGQFFDHGLDLVAKGNAGTVYIPLQPDDPLYVQGSPTNFMVLTRATQGPDGPVNLTTPFVDQNQTYSSHPSHQVFLREYEANPNFVEGVSPAGTPRFVATGHLIEGVQGGMATWADVKAAALQKLGILLTDQDVGNLPLLATNQYGDFVPGANGYAQVVFPGANAGDPPVLVEGTAAGLSLVGSVKTGHAFLDDIAHNAVPAGLADGDLEVGLSNPGNQPGVYDNELLDAHYIAGDGRVNENIGLIAVHSVFHAEHNRLVEHTKDTVLATGDLAFINEWLATDVTEVPTSAEGLNWDGERLFQAAKFGNEMEYQHLVFEEFARKIQPNINVFLVPDGYDVTMNPTIMGEFAHVVYRFGHSMLTETIDRYDTSFNADHISLIEGFLNPTQFHGDPEEVVGSIVRGMTRQQGQEIDEFVTEALRNNLLGLPLDLATINLARGRDTGVPSLNATRREFYEVTNNDTLLKPYESWVDLAANLKNEASIVNFIAAYGDHSLITSQTTAEGQRDAALTIVFGRSFGGLEVPADAVEFLNAEGAWAGGTLGGLENVDLWIGGLAEKIMPFGGMLGSTFNFVFEVQMENLQSGDRFYYLQRLDGLHLFSEMENNSFASMIMRNSDAIHLPSDVFSTPGLILEVDRTKQYNPGLGETPGADGILLDNPETAADESADNLGNDPTGGSILSPLVIRNDPSTVGPDTNYLRYTGEEHVVLGGTDGNDKLQASIGDDALYGDAGNDTLEGGFGNDVLNAGNGDDIVRDMGGDDNIKAGDGNDAVHAGPGLDLVMGGKGQDFIVLGTDMGSEVFAGEGDDFILGNKNAERILGNEGNDWIETGTFDGAPGDNFDEIFARDQVKGHDVFLGDGGFDEFIGEGGDDIMVGSAGVGKMVGMSGFDWSIYARNTAGANADLYRLAFDAAPIPPDNTTLDLYEAVEGLSGSAFNDTLRGGDEDATTRLPQSEGGSNGVAGSALDAEGIARIAGLQAVLGAGVSSFSAGDIILGGDGNDLLQGRGGDDILDGDKWLNVQIGVFAPSDVNHTGAPMVLHNSMTTLMTSIFNGSINPGQLSIVRSIQTANGAGDVDVAVFSGARSEYTITTDNATGRTTVAHTGGLQTDGTDTLTNVERLRFSDMEIGINRPATGAPGISDVTPTETFQVQANVGTMVDPDGIGTISYQWQESSNNGATWTNVGTANTTGSFTPGQAQVGDLLRVIATFTDQGGTVESLVSVPTGIVGDRISGGLGSDNLNGTAGNDSIDGGIVDIGSDNINGGLGADTMSGGTGSDTYTVDNAGDVVTEGSGFLSGTDTVRTTLTSYTLPTNVENLVFIGTGDFAGTGNASGNQITGGAGNDTLNGLAGEDTYQGGLGNDTFYVTGVGTSQDVVNDTGGVDTILTQQGVTSITMGAAIENLIHQGTNAITVTGSTVANSIRGGNGSDNLNGGGGTNISDTLEGGAGNDTLDGGTGNDVFVYGPGAIGADRINNFDQDPALGGQDLIDVRSLGITAANFATEVALVQQGTNVLVTLDNGSILLFGEQLAQINQTDFILV